MKQFNLIGGCYDGKVISNKADNKNLLISLPKKINEGGFIYFVQVFYKRNTTESNKFYYNKTVDTFKELY